MPKVILYPSLRTFFPLSRMRKPYIACKHAVMAFYVISDFGTEACRRLLRSLACCAGIPCRYLGACNLTQVLICKMPGNFFFRSASYCHIFFCSFHDDRPRIIISKGKVMGFLARRRFRWVKYFLYRLTICLVAW